MRMNNSELKEKEKEMQNNQSPENGKGEECAKEFISEMEKEFRAMERPLQEEKTLKPDRFANVEPFEEEEIANAMDLINDDITEIPKLVSPILQRVGLAGFTGSSDVGKSTLGRHLAISVITGRKFLDWEVNPIHRRVIYVSTEDDKSSISALLKKQNKDYGLSPEEFKNLTFIFSTYDIVNRLDKMLSEAPVDLIIIDALTDVLNSDLYKATDVRQFLKQYQELAMRYGCLVLFLHHTRKASENAEPSKNNSLGSQSLEARWRFMAEIRSNKVNPEIKHFCIVKANYLSSNLKTHAFNIEFTENLTFKSLGTTTDFENLESSDVLIKHLEGEYTNIIHLQNQGLSLREIGAILKVSHTAISNKIKRYEKLKENSINRNCD